MIRRPPRDHLTRASVLCLCAGAALLGCSSDRRFLAEDAARDARATLDAPAVDAPVARDDGPRVDGPDGASALDASDVPDASDASDASDVRAGDGALDAVVDAPAEASVVDARVDAPTRADPRCVTAPRVDGDVGSDWGTGALRVSNDTVSAWGAGLNELRALRVCYDATNLYLAVEGTVERGNAIVAYLDRDFGSASGVGALSVLRDRTGALDTALSGGFSLGETAAGFAPEGAWGTVGMVSVASDAVSEAAGLRLFFPVTAGGTDRRENFAYPTGSETRCRTEAPAGCETAIPWRALFELGAGGTLPAQSSVALAVRITNGLGDMSPNQTLPRDDGASPRRISAVLSFDARF